MKNKNEEYAELLELLAKKIKEMKEPISKEITSEIEKISKYVIEEKNIKVKEEYKRCPDDYYFEVGM